MIVQLRVNNAERADASLSEQFGKTVSGFIVAGLLRDQTEMETFLCRPNGFNQNIPHNLLLLTGDTELDSVIDLIERRTQEPIVQFGQNPWSYRSCA